MEISAIGIRILFLPHLFKDVLFCGFNRGAGKRSKFELETCGGVTIWNNDAFVTDYIPFTRNMVKRTSIKIPLQKGENKLILCLDDLAERDTDYYFRLKYQGGQDLSIQLPVPEEVCTEQVYRYEKILDNICFEKETYISEPVILSLPGHLLEQEQLKMSIANGEWVEKMQHEKDEDPALSYELKKDAEKTVPDGFQRHSSWILVF